MLLVPATQKIRGAYHEFLGGDSGAARARCVALQASGTINYASDHSCGSLAPGATLGTMNEIIVYLLIDL